MMMWKDGDDVSSTRWVFVLSSVLAGILLLCFLGSFKIISPGNVGVIFNQLSGGLYSVPQGVALKIPFITTVESYPVALRTYTMAMAPQEGNNGRDDSIDLPTKEGQHIKQDLSVTYNTSEKKAVQVFKSFRGADIDSIESTFIRRTIITVAQNIAGTMSLTDIISTQRDEMQNRIQKELESEFLKMGFIVDKVNLGASHLPQSIEQQMQAKMAAQQEAQKAIYELQKTQTMAQAEVARAEGKANALLINAKAQAEANKMLQESLTPNILKSKWIEKWDGVLSKVSGDHQAIVDLRQ